MNFRLVGSLSRLQNQRIKTGHKGRFGEKGMKKIYKDNSFAVDVVYSTDFL